MLARLGRTPRFAPGHVSVVFGRFVIGARVLLAPLAGLTRMPFHRFVAFDALGCLVWASLFIVTGYASGMKLETMQQGLSVVSTMRATEAALTTADRVTITGSTTPSAIRSP